MTEKELLKRSEELQKKSECLDKIFLKANAFLVALNRLFESTKTLNVQLKKQIEKERIFK